MKQGKVFEIPKQLVWQSYKQVRANKGSAGCDGQTLEEFDRNRDDNLYKIWNRMSSGSYFPPPVLEKRIPKGDGKERVLGIPTVADRIAQGAVKIYAERLLEPEFDEDSYGYRPNKSAHDALERCKRRCWRHSWVLEVDIKSFFDCVRHDLVLKALEHHGMPRWVMLYCKRWLEAPMTDVDSSAPLEKRTLGTPQGGVISPLLANLFLHYAFDRWMRDNHAATPFERYADDIVCHCDTMKQAVLLKEELERRFGEVGLRLHPEKSQIVYVDTFKRHNVRTSFTFLGYDFKLRVVKSRKTGKLFRVCMPGASSKAMKEITRTIRSWRIHRGTADDPKKLAGRYNATLRGWIEYYGKHWYRNFGYRLWSVFQSRLIKWVKSKYRLSTRGAERKLHLMQKENPRLFVHWYLLRAPNT
ncbi:group II intron reverse transcriptase/maturase [Pelagicoccus enzymogenes]|uniref:group II intron reverse transcriptase/maturase n=1 Tax=Pelagicoccus enzymogenes TaxID=2773457 RepID=UPI00280D8125|nr:group II intron reverse transcriptase/maturase [Pelagicoccus enzymogenes]MDQ8200739.1 group II intron reverse transcriptase/maturase [Pelagicoccus enzymogenes]